MAESDPPKIHPLEHVSPERCYELMLAQTAASNASREAREDGLVTTVIQISSAALLLVPGTLGDWTARPGGGFIAFGLFIFLISLVSAVSEQFFSARAHAKHIDVLENYYLKQSDATEDLNSRRIVRISRNIASLTFVVGILVTSIGIWKVSADASGNDDAKRSDTQAAAGTDSSAPAKPAPTPKIGSTEDTPAPAQ